MGVVVLMNYDEILVITRNTRYTSSSLNCKSLDLTRMLISVSSHVEILVGFKRNVKLRKGMPEDSAGINMDHYQIIHPLMKYQNQPLLVNH